MEFMRDQLEDGRSFRLLNVIDEFSREALPISVDFSVSAERVIRTFGPGNRMAWKASSTSL